MKKEIERPFRPFDICDSSADTFSLVDFAAALREEPAYEKNGRTALTIAKSDHLTVVLTVLREGSGLHEHKAPGAATAIILQGKILFRVSDDAAETLGQFQSVVFASDVIHAVEALEDTTLLLIIGGRLD